MAPMTAKLVLQSHPTWTSIAFDSPSTNLRRSLVAAQTEPQRLPVISRNLFVTLLLLIVGGAIVRSAIATRLDGFTIDEAYHIAARVSYVRNADFRINPEHPPLVKLWVGSLISVTGFRLGSIRPFTDKEDERNFTEETST